MKRLPKTIVSFWRLVGNKNENPFDCEDRRGSRYNFEEVQNKSTGRANYRVSSL